MPAARWILCLPLVAVALAGCARTSPPAAHVPAAAANPVNAASSTTAPLPESTGEWVPAPADMPGSGVPLPANVPVAASPTLPLPIPVKDLPGLPTVPPAGMPANLPLAQAARAAGPVAGLTLDSPDGMGLPAMPAPSVPMPPELGPGGITRPPVVPIAALELGLPQMKEATAAWRKAQSLHHLPLGVGAPLPEALPLQARPLD